MFYKQRKIKGHNSQQKFIAELFHEQEKIYSTDKDKSECTITKQKDGKYEIKYYVPNYFNAFNAFEWGRKLLDRLDVSYERACMATPKEEYFTEMLDSLIDDNRRHGTLLSSKKIKETVTRVVEDE